VKSKDRSGIALFILLTSMIILSLSIRELIQMTGLQADRVRYQYNRLQALYLAKSAQSLARFILQWDYQLENNLKKDEASDTNQDLWNLPIPFPIPVELVRSLTGQMAETTGLANKDEVKEVDEEIGKKCDKFFSDFPGTAEYKISDLSSKLNLNDLNNPDVFATLVDLLQTQPEFLQSLQSKGIIPESLAREMRDYMDEDELENDTQSPEIDVYHAAQLEYGPKNRKYTNPDELRLIPSMDDEIYEYLLPFVNTYYIPGRTSPAKININTAAPELLQALMKNVSDAEKIGSDFAKDRTEKKRAYSDKGVAKALEDNFGLSSDKIRVGLLKGTSDAFLIQTTAQVNKVQIQLDSVVGRGKKNGVDPIAFTRLSP